MASRWAARQAEERVEEVRAALAGQAGDELARVHRAIIGSLLQAIQLRGPRNGPALPPIPFGVLARARGTSLLGWHSTVFHGSFRSYCASLLPFRVHVTVVSEPRHRVGESGLGGGLGRPSSRMALSALKNMVLRAMRTAVSGTRGARRVTSEAASIVAAAIQATA